jgi:tetratricopeptide (TPR) repeat protein
VDCGRAVELHIRNGDRNGEAAALDSIGYAHHHLGDHQQAVDHYEQALRLYELISDRTLEADTLGHLSDAQLALGRPAAARRSVLRAAEIFDELGHPDGKRIRAKLAAVDNAVDNAVDVDNAVNSAVGSAANATASDATV